MTARHRLQLREFAHDEVGGVMCIGHNRGWEEAVGHLSGEAVHLQPAHAALLESDAATWKDATESGAAWRLAGVVSPAEGLMSPPGRSSSG